MQDSIKEKDGSYTLEAVWIMLCIFVSIAAVIFMAVSVHDKTMVETICRKIAGMGIHKIQENVNFETGELDLKQLEDKNILWRVLYDFKPTENMVIKKAEEEVKKAVFFGNNPSIKVELCGDKAVMQYEMEWRIPWNIGDSFIPRNMKSIQGKIELKQVESEELIRLCKGLLQ